MEEHNSAAKRPRGHGIERPLHGTDARIAAAEPASGARKPKGNFKLSPIIGAGLGGSMVLLALLVALVAFVLNRLISLPAPALHMSDHSIPLSWPMHSLTQLSAYLANWFARRVVPATQTVAEDSFAFALSAMLYSACKLGVADALGSNGMGIRDLAIATKTDERNLFRLLRALSQYEYFQMDSEGLWYNTHLSSLLRSDHPNAMCALIDHNVEDGWQVMTA